MYSQIKVGSVLPLIAWELAGWGGVGGFGVKILNSPQIWEIRLESQDFCPPTVYINEKVHKKIREKGGIYGDIHLGM